MDKVYQAIDIINNTVDACFVINLDKDRERWRETRHYLESYGLAKVERFSGTLETYGHLGALKSHTDVHKKIRDLDLQSALILEDDVRLHIDMEKNRLCKWDNIINQLNSIDTEEKAIYYLGGRQRAVDSPELLTGSSHGAYAYIMTRSASIRSCNTHSFNIRKLQSFVNKHGPKAAYNGKWRYTDKFHIDNWLTSWKSNYRLSTPLFIHHPHYSSNTKPGETYLSHTRKTKPGLHHRKIPKNF